MTRRKSKLSLDERAALPVAQDNPGLEYLRLNRQEVRETEINSAVRLFLLDEDPISAHLLASAANEIMGALSKGQAGVGLNDVRAFMKEAGVKGDLQEELFASLQHPYNFLKHSSADFSVENDFSVDYVVMGLYTAIHSYKTLFGNLSPEMKTFYGIAQAWRLRQWWPDDPEFETKLQVAHRMGLVDASREEFCEVGRRTLEAAYNAAGY
ncbi:hypothetical protein HGO38_25260 [Rhizobium sp. CG5]|uniref:hypothetical protein n=1 Tax=Rhizobium sp. CG5 TaxID=2726076 RepID=UPI002033CAD2|nr:hypothetical protein [Rhizobium sp. CG5]MCM2476760.1 hypothetical protein [Rhizobium sp. CG5]